MAMTELHVSKCSRSSTKLQSIRRILNSPKNGRHSNITKFELRHILTHNSATANE